ncbi:MAG: hypothetical protein ACOC2D_01085 [Spirochaetota bacterium]
MTRTDELEQCERRLRTLVSGETVPEFALPPPAHLEESVVSELAYAQMQLERHLAETSCAEREGERLRLELAMPTFTSLRLWYNVTAARPRTAGGPPQARPPAE